MPGSRSNPLAPATGSDVMMIGEMRDPETAEIAVQAAMTGRLVFSTLHTNDAIGAVARLLDLGIPEYLIASTLEGVLAQRLVRRICDDCRVAYQPPAELIAQLVTRPIGRVTLGADSAAHRAEEPVSAVGSGCSNSSS